MHVYEINKHLQRDRRKERKRDGRQAGERQREIDRE